MKIRGENEVIIIYEIFFEKFLFVKTKVKKKKYFKILFAVSYNVFYSIQDTRWFTKVSMQVAISKFTTLFE